MNEHEEVGTKTVDDPYVGPRPFEKEDRKFYFGRRHEADKILSQLLARRFLLLYAQSGAGKTSLINALLIPVLENAGLEPGGPLLSYARRRFEVLPVGRVSDAIKLEGVDNIFAFNLMVSLAGNRRPERFTNLRLSNFLLDSVYVDGRLIYVGGQDEGGDIEEEPEPVQEIAGSPIMPRVLIIDQFEELFTFHPHLETEREDFLKQLVEAMEKDPYLLVLLSMRDDYMGRIATYAPLHPDGLRPRYKLKRMDEQAALQAVQRPPEKVDPPRWYDEEVSTELVKYLRRSDSADGQPAGEQEQLDLHVEPVQLQVVCLQLWESLNNKDGGEITMEEVNAAIEPKLDEADLAEDEPLAAFIGTALADYYELAIAEVVDKSRGELSEFRLRNFFSNELITAAGVRNLVARDEVEGIPESSMNSLEDKYHLIRNYMRAGQPFVELVHDSFVKPIRETKTRWEEQRLQKMPWLGAAQSYIESSGKTPLLAGDSLKLAQKQAENMELREEEREYLDASTKAQERRQYKTRLRIIIGGGVILILLALAVFTLILLAQKKDLDRAVSDRKLLHLANELEDYLFATNELEPAILLSYHALTDISPSLQFQGFLFDAINRKLDLESQGMEHLRGRYFAPVDNEQNPLPVDNLFTGPEPDTLATISDGRILWWPVAGAGEVPPVANTYQLRLGAEDASFDKAVFSQDHNLLATSHGPDLRLWWIGNDMEQDSIILGKGETKINALAFSADSRRLAVARDCSAQETSVCGAQIVEVWEIDSDSHDVQLIDSHNLTYGPVVDVAFIDEQGDKLIWGSPKLIGIKTPNKRESQILDAQLRKPLFISALAVVPNEDLLAIAVCTKGPRQEPRCLRSDPGHLIWRFISEQDIKDHHPGTELEIALADIVLHPEKQQIIFSDEPGSFSYWSVNLDEYQKVACGVAGRQLTGDEWETAFQKMGVNEYKAICDEQFGISKSIVEKLVRDCGDPGALKKAKASWEQGRGTAGSKEVDNFNDWAAPILAHETLVESEARTQQCRDELASVLEDTSAAQIIEDVMYVKNAIENANTSLHNGEYREALEQTTGIDNVLQRLPDSIRSVSEFVMSDVYIKLCTGGGLREEEAKTACDRIPVLYVGESIVEEGNAGQRYWLLEGGQAGDYLNIGVTSSQSDAQVSLGLYDSQFADLGGFIPNLESDVFSAQIEYYLPQDGPHYLAINQESVPVPYTISLAVTKPETIRIGEKAEADADHRLWKFSGKAGDRVAIKVQADDSDEPRLAFYDSQLGELLSQPFGDKGAEILLPEDGDYYLDVGWLEDAQPYTLSTAVVESESIQIGETAKADANQRFWQFSGQAGDHVTIDVEASKDGDPWLSLLNSSFEEIYFNRDSDDLNLNPRIDRWLQEDGLYYIEVGWDNDPVPYVISLVKE